MNPTKEPLEGLLPVNETPMVPARSGRWRWVEAVLSKLPLGSSYAMGSLTLAGGILLSQGIAFVGGLLLARFMYPPAAQDMQAGFVALVATLVPLATLRYDVGIVMPEDEASAHHVFRLSLAIGIAASVLSLPVVLLCHLLGWGRLAVLGWLPITLLAQAISTSVIGWCNRLHLFGMQTTSKVVQAAMFPLLAALAFSWGGAQPVFLPAAFAVASLFGAVVIIGALRMARKCPPLEIGTLDAREMLVVARRYRLLPLINLPMYVANMASLAVLVWALQFFAAGTSACFMLVMQMLRVPVVLLGMAIGQVYTARAARLVNQPAALQRLTFRTMGGLALLGLPMGLFFLLLGPWIFTTGYGEPWRQAGEFSQWLGWGAGAGLVVTPLAMLPTILHSNLGQLIMTLAMAIGRCLVAWLAVRTHSEMLAVVGTTVIDVLGGFYFLGYLVWLLRRRRVSDQSAGGIEGLRTGD